MLFEDLDYDVEVNRLISCSGCEIPPIVSLFSDEQHLVFNLDLIHLKEISGVKVSILNEKTRCKILPPFEYCCAGNKLRVKIITPQILETHLLKIQISRPEGRSVVVAPFLLKPQQVERSAPVSPESASDLSGTDGER